MSLPIEFGRGKRMVRTDDRPVAFVLGGGGLLGMHQTGMLSALHEAGITPDVVVGVSSGALQGVIWAAEPSAQGLIASRCFWHDFCECGILHRSRAERVVSMTNRWLRARTSRRLRALVERHLPAEGFEDLRIPFHCLATSADHGTEQWFSRGRLVPAISASIAVPALMEPVRIDGENLVDGGLVNSVPIQRAVHLGARTIYVLPTIAHPSSGALTDRQDWRLPFTLADILQRHQYVTALGSVPGDVAVHVLPMGKGLRIGRGLAQQFMILSGEDGVRRVEVSIMQSHLAARGYLREHGLGSWAGPGPKRPARPAPRTASSAPEPSRDGVR
ncbi:patatin-like phospholipase family protein [Spirillospora sp. CA-253888]